MAKQEAAAGSPTRLVLQNVRFSYVSVFKPKSFRDGPEKYSVVVLLPKDDEDQYEKLLDAFDAACEAGKSKKWGGKIPKKLKELIHDGDDSDDENYAGMWHFTASSTSQPGIVNKRMEPATSENDFYSGCWGNVCVNLYAYSEGSNGVAAGLQHVMKTKDDTPFAGGISVEEAFGALIKKSDAKRGARDEAPRKSRRAADDEDEEDAPPRRSAKPAPAAKRRRDDDDDEDGAPRKSRRAADDDDDDEDAPPRRSSTASTPAKRRPVDDDDDEDDLPPRKSNVKPAAKAAAKPTSNRRSRSYDDEDED